MSLSYVTLNVRSIKKIHFLIPLIHFVPKVGILDSDETEEKLV